MKRLVLVFMLAALAIVPAMAQSTAYTGTPYTSLSAATAAGPGTVYAVMPSPFSFTWTVATSGTVTAATVNFEGSICTAAQIAANTAGCWFQLDQAVNTDTQWSSGEMRHVVNKGINFIRLNLISISGGGSITGTIALFK